MRAQTESWIRKALWAQSPTSATPCGHKANDRWSSIMMYISVLRIGLQYVAGFEYRKVKKLD